MQSILLGILKYGLLSVGVLLGIVLLLVLLILFVPVRYDAFLENEEALKAKGKVHWLLHIVTFEVVYEEEKLKKVLKIFGFPVWKESEGDSE